MKKKRGPRFNAEQNQFNRVIERDNWKMQKNVELFGEQAGANLFTTVDSYTD